MTDKERYATIGTWVEVFRKEGYEINGNFIRRRFSLVGVNGIDGRHNSGKLLPKGFYAESDVRALVFDLLQSLPQVSEDGTFEKDGEIYGTPNSFSRLLAISNITIRSRLRQSSVVSVKGKLSTGKIADFYPFSETRKLCENLIQSVLQVEKNGLCNRGGSIYGTIFALAKKLTLSEKIVTSRIGKAALQPIPGKDVHGRMRSFYSLCEVQKLCTDLLEDIPQMVQGGTFEKNGETYGTVVSLAKWLGVSSNSIISRLEKNPLESIYGRDTAMHIRNCYALSKVRDLCADLFAKRQSE